MRGLGCKAAGRWRTGSLSTLPGLTLTGMICTALVFTGLVTIIIAGLAGFTGLNIFTHWQILKFNGMKEISFLVGFMSVLALIHGIIALVMKGFITEEMSTKMVLVYLK